MRDVTPLSFRRNRRIDRSRWLAASL